MAITAERKKIVALSDWLRESTKGQRDAVAALAQTSVANLYQVAGGHTGLSIEKARLIYAAIKEITPDRSIGFDDLCRILIN